MSYALELADDASRAARSLPVMVQEAVFDVLDRIAEEAEVPTSDDFGTQVVVVRSERELAYVEVQYAVDRGRRVVTLQRLFAVLDNVI